MDDKLFERVTFMNHLMDYFNRYYDFVKFAMTTASIHTRDEYEQMKELLKAMSSQGESLIKMIPKGEDQDFKDDSRDFLTLIVERLDNAFERYIHLEAKSFREEKYSFSQDRVYVKKDRALEKEIASLGERMNRYKEETGRMLSNL